MTVLLRVTSGSLGECCLTDPTLIDLECFLVSFSCFNLAEKLVSKVKIEWKLTIACLFVFCCFFCSFVNSDYYFILIFFY